MDIILMSENTIQTQAFKLKGRLYTFAVLQILTTECDLFVHQLIETIARAPKLFDKTPVVLDLSAVNHLEFDLLALLEASRAQGIIPVAIQGGGSFHNTLAQCQGLAVLHASVTQDRPVIERPIDSNSTVEQTKTKLITTPVRSGQQIVAKNTDLIIVASVSHGAELLSDASIHVYGTLRGRALAGISGDKEARIFCQSLEAELVSIAGFYRLSDAIEPYNRPCQIYLLDEHIHIEPL
jgi:septum site-determining protein MinC